MPGIVRPKAILPAFRLIPSAASATYLLALLCLFAVLNPHAAWAATAPVSLDRDVSDISAWLDRTQPAGSQDEPIPGDWYAVEIWNPTKDKLTRVVTIDSGAAGILRFFDAAFDTHIHAAMPLAEGSHTELITWGEARAVRLTFDPLAKAKFAIAMSGSAVAPSWKIWKPEVLAAAQSNETLTVGLLSGASLMMMAWLTSLAAYRRAPEPFWSATTLACLVVLLLGPSILKLPVPVLHMSAAIMVACVLRSVSTHLGWPTARPRLSVLFDGAVFAIVAFAALTIAGFPEAAPILRALYVIVPSIIILFAAIDALRGTPRSRAILPGLLILLLAGFLPAFAPASFWQQITDLSLLVDAMITTGLLAMTFTAALPPEPELSEHEIEALSSEGRKAREAEYRYALGLAAAHQGLWDWNFENDTLFVSPSVEALLGLDAGGLTSSERKWADLIIPEDIRIYADSMNAHRKQGNSSFTIEMRMRHAKGGTRWIQLRASCMADTKGKATRCIGVVSDITARKSQDMQRATNETSDETTGLMSRNGFIERLDSILSQMKSGRSKRHGAVLAIDVDRLRTITDSMGHAAGDAFLAQIARRLDHAAGPDDAVARIGTDEFAVLALGSHGDEDGAQVAQRIRDALTQPVAVGPREIYPAASIGLALIEPTHRYASDVLREAEVAMYHAKRAGRGGFEIYQPLMKPRSADRLSMDADLRTALDRDQIEIHYQPIIRLSDNTVAGFEALMRWRHPSRGLLSPAEFIPLAEETGLIVPLGSYAVERAAVELKNWQTYYPMREPLFCSVNVSARQLMRDEFFEDVIDILSAQRPERMTLKLELTESCIVQNPDLIATALGHLRDAGAGLSLDDFGTGFSSLSYLHRFPFDTVKIDRSFVADMARNAETPVVLRSIIRLAHDLDMSVVAEGVETQSEAISLRKLECEFAQGFLFGAPMNASAAMNLIATYGKQQAAAPRSLPRPAGSGPARVPRKL